DVCSSDLASANAREARVPYRAEEEIDGAYKGEEAQRFTQERKYDAKGGQDRDYRASDQQITDYPFDLVAGTETRADAVSGEIKADRARAEGARKNNCRCKGPDTGVGRRRTAESPEAKDEQRRNDRPDRHQRAMVNRLGVQPAFNLGQPTAARPARLIGEAKQQKKHKGHEHGVHAGTSLKGRDEIICIHFAILG